MKGKAEAAPTNHVIWANGFKSNMPDWPTARRVAASDRLLYLCRQARTLLFQIERGEVDKVTKKVFIDNLQETLAYADVGIMPQTPMAEEVSTPSKAFPLPPGVK